MIHYCKHCHRPLPADPAIAHDCLAPLTTATPYARHAAPPRRFRVDWAEVAATLAVSSGLAFVVWRLFEAMF